MRHLESRRHETLKYSFHAKGAAILHFLRANSKVLCVSVCVCSHFCFWIFATNYIPVKLYLLFSSFLSLVPWTVGIAEEDVEESAARHQGSHHEVPQVSVWGVWLHPGTFQDSGAHSECWLLLLLLLCPVTLSTHSVSHLSHYFAYVLWFKDNFIDWFKDNFIDILLPTQALRNYLRVVCCNTTFFNRADLEEHRLSLIHLKVRHINGALRFALIICFKSCRTFVLVIQPFRTMIWSKLGQWKSHCE